MLTDRGVKEKGLCVIHIHNINAMYMHVKARTACKIHMYHLSIVMYMHAACYIKA